MFLFVRAPKKSINQSDKYGDKYNVDKYNLQDKYLSAFDIN